MTSFSTQPYLMGCILSQNLRTTAVCLESAYRTVTGAGSGGTTVG
jgi:hypothetical protein